MALLSSSVELKTINYQNLNSININSLVDLLRTHWKIDDQPLPVNSVNYFLKELKISDRLYKQKYYILAEYDFEIVGYIRVWLNLRGNNTKTAMLGCYVKKEFRNNGIFKKMLSECLDTLPQKVNLVSFVIRADQNFSESGHNSKMIQYLESHGGKLGLTARRSISNIRKNFEISQVKEKAEKLLHEANLNGYSIIFKNDIYDFNNERCTLSEYLEMLESIVNDMPREDSSWDDEEFSVDEYLSWKEYHEILNRKVWAFIAFDSANKPVAMTDSFFSPDVPEVIHQGDTGVIESHRGKGLGLTLKYQMLYRLLTHQDTKNAIYWSTFNAKSNKYMIRINDELCYEENGIWKNYEFKVHKLKSVLK